MTNERIIYPKFTEKCLKTFEFLVNEYNFNQPKIQTMNYEQYIFYQKEKNTVSVVYWEGSVPIVELYYPSYEFKNRFFPSYNPKRITEIYKTSNTEETSISHLLEYWALVLRNNEQEFLKGNPPNNHQDRIVERSEFERSLFE